MSWLINSHSQILQQPFLSVCSVPYNTKKVDLYQNQLTDENDAK